MSKVSITINSRHYTVTAAESEEYIRSLCDYINEKVALVLSGGTNVIGERPIVLAALNICDEYFKVKEAGYTIGEQMMRYNEKIEEEQNKNEKLRSRVAALETELEQMKSDQISLDMDTITIKELQDELEKAQNRVKYLEGKLGFGRNNNGRY